MSGVLVADGWVTEWEAHWPINSCTAFEHGAHLMHKSGTLFQCEGCYKFFTTEDAGAFMAAAQRIANMLNDRHRKN